VHNGTDRGAHPRGVHPQRAPGRRAPAAGAGDAEVHRQPGRLASHVVAEPRGRARGAHEPAVEACARAAGGHHRHHLSRGAHGHHAHPHPAAAGGHGNAAGADVLPRRRVGAGRQGHARPAGARAVRGRARRRRLRGLRQLARGQVPHAERAGVRLHGLRGGARRGAERGRLAPRHHRRQRRRQHERRRDADGQGAQRAQDLVPGAALPAARLPPRRGLVRQVRRGAVAHQEDDGVDVRPPGARRQRGDRRLPGPRHRRAAARAAGRADRDRRRHPAGRGRGVRGQARAGGRAGHDGALRRHLPRLRHAQPGGRHPGGARRDPAVHRHAAAGAARL
ncbi:MAG: Lipase, partial [uncultured Gemmatimonadetes bacterium]